jgi:hypothetical protein
MSLKTMRLCVYHTVNTRTSVVREQFTSLMDSVTYIGILYKLFMLSVLGTTLNSRADFFLGHEWLRNHLLY